MFSVSLTISVVSVAPLKKLSSLDARFDHSRYYVVWLLMIFFQLMLIIVPTLLKIEELRNKDILRYESSTLILYKELSSTIFQSLSVSQSVSKASVTPDQIFTLCNT